MSDATTELKEILKNESASELIEKTKTTEAPKATIINVDSASSNKN